MTPKDAERAVARILRQLEADTDLVIDRVELVDVEVTAMQDSRPMMWREVSIKTHRLPGHQWAQAQDA